MFRLCITGDLGFEFWKDIPGYEGLYQASTYGRVRSVKRNVIRVSTSHRNGYLGINLSKNGAVKRLLVHRLIASTYLPKWKPEYTQVNHKSEVKTENQVWNLEYCNVTYNANYGTRAKRITKNNTGNPQLSKPVARFDIYGNFIEKYISAREAHRLAGFSQDGICRCCKGKNKTCGGYVWKYA